jgi:DNA-binding ferritin-like protein
MEDKNITRQECFENHKMINEKLDKIDEKVNALKVQVVQIPEKILEKTDLKYVEKAEFKTVQKIVYTLVGVILLAVLYALLRNIGLTL